VLICDIILERISDIAKGKIKKSERKKYLERIEN
jgi:hypothetical protein